jgi:hypothetical protein
MPDVHTVAMMSGPGHQVAIGTITFPAPFNVGDHDAQADRRRICDPTLRGPVGGELIMNIVGRAASLALISLMLVPAASLAQTETEQEQLVFVELATRRVQLPASFAGAVCGLGVDEVIAEFSDSIDPACSVDEAAAAGMGLTDENGDIVDMTLQDFVNVQLPDNETRVQMPMSFATRLCGLALGELSDDAMSERQVACELTPEQMAASNLPGLSLAEGGSGAAGSDAENTGGETSENVDTTGAEGGG